MALLVATMCDRECYQRAVKEYAEHALTVGSPLHTISLLFSAQLQPLAERALDGSETNSSIWGYDADELRRTWKYHLAAIISNRTVGWDKIVLTLGDRLLELGDVKEAHFCFMVCGSPLSSPSHPSSRMAIVGCDHLVPMDVALMTSEGIDAYERSEAYEWAKRLGNRSAAIQSLQPFKLIYASLLCDLGFKNTAERYLQSIRLCSGLSQADQGGNAIPSPFACFADRATLANAINAFEARLHMQTAPEAKAAHHIPAVRENNPVPPSVASSQALSNNIVLPNDDDMTFVSAKSNLLDVTVLSTFEIEASSNFVRENNEKAMQEIDSHPPEQKPLKLESKSTNSAILRESNESKPVTQTAMAAAAPNDNGKPAMATTKQPVRSPRGALRTRKGDGATKKISSDGRKRVPDKKDTKAPSDADKKRPVTSKHTAAEGGPPVFLPQPTGNPAVESVPAPSMEHSHGHIDPSSFDSSKVQVSPLSVVGPPKATTTENVESTKPPILGSPVSAPFPGRQEPPMSAPAVMAATGSKTSSKPPPAPSSEKSKFFAPRKEFIIAVSQMFFVRDVRRTTMGTWYQSNHDEMAQSRCQNS